MGVPKMKTAIRLMSLALVAAALSGCSSWFEKKQEQPPCPRVSILSDASRVTHFRPGPGRDLTDVVLQAEFGNYSGSCYYDFKTETMSLKMQVGIDVARGPAAEGRKDKLSYFIAIPAFYPKPEAKIVMPVEVEFPANTDKVRYTDNELEVTMPIKKLRDLAQYEVFLGFQMEPAEIEYNRSQRQR